jgi:hypothetical protein
MQSFTTSVSMQSFTTAVSMQSFTTAVSSGGHQMVRWHNDLASGHSWADPCIHTPLSSTPLSSTHAFIDLTCLHLSHHRSLRYIEIRYRCACWVIALRPQTSKHIRGSRSHYADTDTSEQVVGFGSNNVVTVQSRIQRSKLSVTSPMS